MKQVLIICGILLSHAFCRGQYLSDLITKEITENPDKAIRTLKSENPRTLLDRARKEYVLGKCYAYLNEEDTALTYFIQSKKEFEKTGHFRDANDVALDAYLVVSSQENYDKFGTTFLDEYYDYATRKKSDTCLAFAYNEYAKNAYSLFDFDKRSNVNVLDSALIIYNKGLYHAEKAGYPLIEAKIYSNIGTLYNTKEKYDSARYYMDKARMYIDRTGDVFELFVNYYSYGNSYFKEGNYNKALEYFLKANGLRIPYYREKIKRLLYKKIAETYDYLDDTPNRRMYQKLYLDLDQKIKDQEQDKIINEANTKYEVEKKDKMISGLLEIKDKFSRNKLIFGILLFLVFLLALYSFVRWKKVDFRKKRVEMEKHAIESEKYMIEKEKKVIEKEHDKAVEQLEKVKQLVMEDHIILKDRTKLYLNKLLYIKSEDHYLNIISTDGKNHFIRGRLNQILAELPPNFVKCHRSYIVNTNFIKSVSSKSVILENKEEIPVSRNFKL